MSGVRPTHPHQQIVFSGKMGCYVTFAFASIFAADQHIDEPQVLTAIKPKVRGRSDDNIILRATICFDYYVRDRFKTLDLTLSWVSQHFRVGSKFLESLLPFPLFVATGENLFWRFEVNVEDPVTKPALLIASWVFISTMATFSKAPL
jgi:hypothetical protein